MKLLNYIIFFVVLSSSVYAFTWSGLTRSIADLIYINNDGDTMTGDLNIGSGGYASGGITLTTAGGAFVQDLILAGNITKIGGVVINGSLNPAAGINVSLGNASNQWGSLNVSGNSYTQTMTIIGNLDVDSNTLFVNAGSNRVGIGTTSPTALLDVNGDMVLSGGSQNYNFTSRLNTLAIQSQTSGTESLLELFTKDGVGTEELEIRVWAVGTPDSITNREFLQLGYDPNINTFHIETQASGTGVARDFQIRDDGTIWMTFIAGGGVSVAGALNASSINTTGGAYFATSSGSVGIGTSSPAETLEVEDDSTTTGIQISNTAADGDPFLAFALSGTKIFTMGVDDGDASKFKIGTTAIGTDTRVTIDSSGDFGIGTSSPGARLHAQTSASGDIAFFQTSADGGQRLDIGIDTTNKQIFFDPSDSTDTYDITFFKSDATPMLSLDQSTGNVGIGTTVPTERLVVIGNATFNNTDGDDSIFIDTTNDAILFTGENGSLYQPVYGTDDDLILYLPFSRGGNSSFSVATSNVSVYDRSPYGNDGQCYGTDLTDGCNWTTGKYGNALLFDGVDDYVQIELDNADVSDSITECLWINPKELPSEVSSFADIIDKDGDTWDFFFRQSTAVLEWKLVTDGGTNSVTVPESEITKNAWNYICGTYDGVIKRVYINGVEKGSVAETGDVTNTDTTLFIGRDNLNPQFFFNGSIDEVMIYSRALTPEEIRTHYLRGSGYGASGAITADKFRIVNTSGSRTMELNTTTFEVFDNSGADAFVVNRVNGRASIGTTVPSVQFVIMGNLSINASNGVGGGLIMFNGSHICIVSC